MAQPLLAGDLGGTKTLLLLAKNTPKGLQEVYSQRYTSADFSGLAAIIVRFLQAAQQPADALSASCFGVAGPVQAQRSAQITNLPWTLDSNILAKDTGIPAPILINDFEAIGYGIAALSASERLRVKPGHPIAHSNQAILGAGTGLGQAILVPEPTQVRVLATQGGHVDFAPTNEQQMQLWQYLRQTQARVSYEDLLSGPGLVRIFQFLAATQQAAVCPQLSATMTAAAIQNAATAQHDPLASLALALFVQIYGAQAGNLALSSSATGGVYLAGGIAPKIVTSLRTDTFSQAFLDKGPMRSFLEDIPVWVIANPRVGLLGAAQLALQRSTA